MKGMNSESGAVAEGIAYLDQLVRDVLTTPIGSRVMRRSYGSRLFNLIDSPLNSATVASIHAAVVEALTAHVPLLTVTAVVVEPINASEFGRLQLRIEGYTLNDQSPVEISGITL